MGLLLILFVFFIKSQVLFSLLRNGSYNSPVHPPRCHCALIKHSVGTTYTANYLRYSTYASKRQRPFRKISRYDNFAIQRVKLTIRPAAHA